jgi:hypothetical protein
MQEMMENDGAREDASTLSTLRSATEDGRSRATAEDGRPPKFGALRAATGERGKRANFKFLTVRDLVSAWTGGGYGNAEGAAHGHCGSPQVEAGAARGHWGRFGTAQLQIPDRRFQIGQRGTTDCRL